MPAYTEDNTEAHKSQVRTLMVLNPNSGCRVIADMLKEATDGLVALDYKYVNNLMNDIRNERALRYSDAQKMEVVAQVEDFTHWVITQQRKLLQDPKASPFVKNQILNSMQEGVYKLLNIKMDAGILERHLGTLKTTQQIVDMVEALKLYREEKQDETVHSVPVQAEVHD